MASSISQLKEGLAGLSPECQYALRRSTPLSRVHPPSQLLTRSFMPGRTTVTTVVQGFIPRRVTCTGHALGGGLASLAACWAALTLATADIRCITFGAPRVGNSDFKAAAENLVGIMFRVVFESDPTPHHPRPVFYSHAGHPIWLHDGEALYQVRRGLWQRRGLITRLHCYGFEPQSIHAAKERLTACTLHGQRLGCSCVPPSRHSPAPAKELRSSLAEAVSHRTASLQLCCVQDPPKLTQKLQHHALENYIKVLSDLVGGIKTRAPLASTSTEPGPAASTLSDAAGSAVDGVHPSAARPLPVELVVPCKSGAAARAGRTGRVDRRRTRALRVRGVTFHVQG